MKGYTTKIKIQNYILSDISDLFDDQVDYWIESVERIIDNLTSRNFIADSEATARLFDGDDTPELLIDDAVEITKVEAGNDDYGSSFSEIESSGSERYFLEPVNYSAKGLPVTKIALRTRCFYYGKQNQRITAKWGYSVAVPKDIEFVATVFVAGIINQSRQGGDQVKSEKIGNYSVSYNTDDKGDSWADFEKAKDILNTYKKLFI